jgi:hypothetical protein
MWYLPLLALLMASSVVVPATGAASQRMAPTADTTSANDDCQPLSGPKRLPEAWVVVDSSLLQQGITSLGLPPDTEVVASLIPGTGQRPPKIELGIARAPTFRDQQLLTSLRAAIRSTATFDAPSIRLTVHVSSAVSVTLTRSVLCQPVLVAFTETRVVRLPFSVERVSPGSPSSRPSLTPNWRPEPVLLVDAEGQVREAKLSISSGDPTIDRQFLEPLRDQRFHPALLDGRPVAVWLGNNRTEVVP